MKIATDDYHAKIRAWVHHPQPFQPAVAEGLPRFSCQRFSRFEEMNAWKQEYRRALTRAGGVKWRN